MNTEDAFGWTEVKTAKHFAGLSVGPVVDSLNSVRLLDMVRAWYPEQACAGRWTSKACPGTVDFAFSSIAPGLENAGRMMVCEACAARAMRHAVSVRVFAEMRREREPA